MSASVYSNVSISGPGYVKSHASSSSYSSYSMKSSTTFDLVDGCVSCLGRTLTTIALVAIGIVVLGVSVHALVAGSVLVAASIAFHSLEFGLFGAGYVLGAAVGLALTTQIIRKAINLI